MLTFYIIEKRISDKTTLNFTTANDDTDPTVVITAQEVIDGDVIWRSNLIYYLYPV